MACWAMNIYLHGYMYMCKPIPFLCKRIAAEPGRGGGIRVLYSTICFLEK